MKHLLIFLLCVSAYTASAQLNIDITITADGKAQIMVKQDTTQMGPGALVQLADSNNSIVVHNNHNLQKFRIIFKSSETNKKRPFSFAINPEKPLISLSFRKDEVTSWMTSGSFSLPCDITVLNAESKTVADRTIESSESDRVAYYDAMLLAGMNGKLTQRDIMDISDFYDSTTLKSQNTLDARKKFSGNPFITADTLVKYMSVQDSANNTNLVSTGFGGLVSSFSGLDITTIAEGMSQFMIARAKEELNITFFQKFEKKISQYPELKILFPATEKLFQNIAAYQYTQMLPALRVAFDDDIRKFGERIDDIFQLPKYRALLREFPEMRIGIQTLRIVQKLDANAHPAKIIEDFANLEDWSDPSTSIQFRNLGNAIRLTWIFSESLRYKEGSSPDHSNIAWVTPEQLNDLITNKQAFNIYLGLIYEQVQKYDIRFIYMEKGKEIIVPFTETMTDYKKDAFIFQGVLSEFITLADKVERLRTDIEERQKSSTKPTPDDYYTYISTSIDVISYGFDIIKHFDNHVHPEEYIKLARTGNELYRNIYRKEYPSAVLNGVQIIQITIGLFGNPQNVPAYDTATIKALAKNLPDINADIDRIATFVADNKNMKFSDCSLKKIRPGIENVYKRLRNLTAAERAEIGEETVRKAEKLCALLLNVNNLEDLEKQIPDLVKYGVFVGEIATAKTADDVQAIIESAVLPAGSASIKKNSRFNLSVQSYLGVYYQPNPSSGLTSWNAKTGMHAPIGLSASLGLGCKKKDRNYGSISAFVSVFDIGAIVDYQLTTDSAAGVQKDYKIELGQIVAPGAYLVYGFPGNIPVSIGYGCQYGPGLGRVESSGTIVNNPAWRFNGFISVDIPLVTLINYRRR
jgi:hypothetical protein